jgi:hypothetical protein
MNFLGRKLNGHFQGEVVSDLSSFACRRVGGSRIKHRVKQNWLKMYDKTGPVLRVETVINNPEEFRVRKQVLRDGKQRAGWVPLRKGVAYLFRYREISQLQANARYLDALAAVDDPTPGKQALQRLTTVKKDAAGRSCPGFNPLAQHDATLFKASWPASTACTASPTGTSAPPADSDALTSLVCRRSEESKCQSQSLLPPPTCPRTDRQDSAHASLACDPLWPKRHGDLAVPARASLPQCLLRRRALIIFAKNKELTAKESILRRRGRATPSPPRRAPNRRRGNGAHTLDFVSPLRRSGPGASSPAASPFPGRAASTRPRLLPARPSRTRDGHRSDPTLVVTTSVPCSSRNT